MSCIISRVCKGNKIEFHSWSLKEPQRSVITLKCEHDLLMIVYAYKLACIILRLFCSSLWGSVSLKLNIYTTYNLLYPHILSWSINLLMRLPFLKIESFKYSQDERQIGYIYFIGQRSHKILKIGSLVIPGKFKVIN